MVYKCKVTGKLLLSVSFLFLSSSLSAIDIGLRAIPEVMLPVGSDFASNFSLGGGATLSADTQLFPWLFPYTEFGMRFSPRATSSEMLMLANGGAGLGCVYYPVSRLKLNLAAAGGLYMGTFMGESTTDLYWKLRGEAGYRFTPTLSVLGSVDYTSYQDYRTPGSPLFNGICIGIVANIGVSLGADRGTGLDVRLEQTAPVFPIRSALYATDSFGSITIVNNESTEIEDVVVQFSVDGISSGPVSCATYNIIKKRQSVTSPLKAALGERSLDFTETSKAQGSITITYKVLDKRVSRSFPAAIDFNHRNAFQWEKPEMLCAFVSPNDGVVLDLSKYSVGLVRERLRADLDNNLQFGIAVFEGLRLMGLTWNPDPQSSYADCRNDSSRLDYIQYPYQTFAYRGGDSDDLAILIAASLESVGLSSALVPLKDKVLVAFALESPETQARKFFNDPEAFIWKDEKAWVVLDPTKLREGFLSAWKSGAERWGQALADGEDASFFRVAEAWKTYAPAGVTASDFRLAKPREDLVAKAFENSMTVFVAAEVKPKAERIIAEFDKAGPTAKQLNSLGILYARYGLLAEAREYFQKAAEKGSDSASVNLANTVFLLKDYQEASRLYRKILTADSANKAARLGLSRSLYELDQYAESASIFSELEKADPSYSARYAYLSVPRETGTRRGSSLDSRKGVPWPQ